ncbi:putative short chain oxidoreductase [Saitoella complicata NRRL Y-17804]|uniref:putative short chain oxidoreductase n=1 Tax=Saitoella complicata (strain BCRC 22490 / CBS 7301 / JCM 7358 / NBRC 10748 / NRRL Y-17804) TaxID=698492 RepID=UPI00086702D9|nr:putative short chain oxidoreductase [Saitoella complicata NRRL Y-17804]ODQ53552.1 putative short chain oxidoreductase [Saitoella complicata NRRL Y-17804]
MTRVALVTGSSRGIGRAIALRLARDGLDICLNDIPANQPGLDSTRSEIEKLGRKCIAIPADVTKSNEVTRMVEQCAKELGSLDVMVANAGIAQIKPLLDVTEEEWDGIFGVNCKGVFLCYQAAAKQMIKQGVPSHRKGGKIIGACSIVGYRPFPMLSPYSATKWGVRGLTQGAAMEWAKHGITVNAYCPGIVGTAMWDQIDEVLAKEQGTKKGEVFKKYSNELIALGRSSEPEDVANFVHYLASEDSDYMTGQSVMIDGGIQFS